MPGFQALSVILSLTAIPMIYRKKKNASNVKDKRKKEENK